MSWVVPWSRYLDWLKPDEVDSDEHHHVPPLKGVVARHRRFRCQLRGICVAAQTASETTALAPQRPNPVSSFRADDRRRTTP